MRVEVDRDRCEGNAVCVGIAPPDLFDLDEDDYAVIKADPVPADQEDLAEQAVAECRAQPDPKRLEVFINWPKHLRYPLTTPPRSTCPERSPS